MRIICPHCGERGNEEFTYLGAAGVERPQVESSPEQWHEYVYQRENPAGFHQERWHHLHGCRRWLVVMRDTRTHAIIDVIDSGGVSAWVG
jgi:sarcosine oxidase subunit delta